MKQRFVQTACRVAAGLLVTCGVSFAQAPKQQKLAMDGMLAKVKDALPAQADVTPNQARKVLVFDLTCGFHHSSIDVGGKTLKMMGEKTHAFSAEVTEDISAFEAENLKQYDVVVMLNTTGELFTPKDFKTLSPEKQAAAKERETRLKKSLIDYVNGGKGLVGIHAATDAFYQWPQYGKMMGGYFAGHPWHEHVCMKLDDAASPIMKGFEGKSFEVTDEIYQFKDPYSRENVRVLMSLDVTKCNMNKVGKDGKSSIKRTDNDFPVSWVRQEGKGRIFYVSLGHREEIYWNPMVLKHYLAGIQFASGDLKVDATPK